MNRELLQAASFMNQYPLLSGIVPRARVVIIFIVLVRFRCNTDLLMNKTVSYRFKEAFRSNALGLTQTYEIFKLFEEGRLSVDEDERSGRHSTGTTAENVAKVREAIPEDQRRMIYDVRDFVELLYGTCLRIASRAQHATHCDGMCGQASEQ
jgi:hypothetical protein